MDVLSRLKVTGPLFLLFSIAYILSFQAGLAYAGKMYRYVDEKGVVSITDNYGSIPEKYRDTAKEVMVDKRTYGYTPSVKEAIGSEKYSTDSWFDYGSMPVYKRWFLIARAGFIDIVPILKKMTPWIGLAAFIVVAAYFIVFRVFQTSVRRGGVLMLVVVLVVFGLFIKYMDVVQGQSDLLVKKVRALRNMDARQRELMISVLESAEK